MDWSQNKEKDGNGWHMTKQQKRERCGQSWSAMFLRNMDYKRGVWNIMLDNEHTIS